MCGAKQSHIYTNIREQADTEKKLVSQSQAFKAAWQMENAMFHTEWEK